MKDKIEIDTNVVCAGCNQPVTATSESAESVDKPNHYVMKIKVDWHKHAMCAAGFAKEPGQA